MNLRFPESLKLAALSSLLDFLKKSIFGIVFLRAAFVYECGAHTVNL